MSICKIMIKMSLMLRIKVTNAHNIWVQRVKSREQWKRIAYRQGEKLCEKIQSRMEH